MLIPNKDVFYELAFQGKCGNTPVMWKDIGDFSNYVFEPGSGIDTLFKYYAIRTKNRLDRKTTSKIIGSNLSSFIFNNQLQPGEYIITKIPQNQDVEYHCLQGEITVLNNEIHLYYTHVYGYMREKLSKYGKTCTGHTAMYLMEKYCDRKSFEMIYGLLETYTENEKFPIIEFTCLPSGVENFGIIPNVNTIIWEVRHY